MMPKLTGNLVNARYNLKLDQAKGWWAVREMEAP